MYTFKGLTAEQEIMIGSIVRNETVRAAAALKRERDNLEYQRENSHIFLNDGTINATEKKITQLEARKAAADLLLSAITIA